MGVFGSGWVWLVFDASDKSLSIVSTPNQVQPSTLTPPLSSINPPPSTLNPQPSTLNLYA